jgi:hypothetical protein
MRAQGLGEIVVLGTDIYEIFTAGAQRLGRERQVRTAFSDEVAGRSILLRNALELPGAAAKSKKKF